MLVSKDAFTGLGDHAIRVLSGSRMLVTLQIIEIDPATTVNLFVDNGYSVDVPFDTIEGLSINGVGSVKRIINDFNNIFNFRYVVTGGMASIRVAIAVYDNSGTTRIDNAQLDVNLDHTTDALGHYDSTRIGDGNDLAEINTDGSFNFNLDNGATEIPLFPYGEATAVPPAVEAELVSYTVPVGKIGLLYRAECSGDNIAHYKIYLNGDAIASRRTHHGSGLTTDFDFSSPNKRSVQLEAGDVLTVKVSHNRPADGDFESRLVLLEKPVA